MKERNVLHPFTLPSMEVGSLVQEEQKDLERMGQ